MTQTTKRMDSPPESPSDDLGYFGRLVVGAMLALLIVEMFLAVAATIKGELAPLESAIWLLGTPTAFWTILQVAKAA